jgi:hypothetical protein
MECDRSRGDSRKEKSNIQSGIVQSATRPYHRPKLVRGPRLSAITAEDAAITGVMDGG